MSKNIYDELKEISAKSTSGNGRLKIVLVNDDGSSSEEIMQLNWENVVDMNMAMEILNYCKHFPSRLNLPDVHWAKKFEAIGEESKYTQEKIKFLFDHFVGTFAY